MEFAEKMFNTHLEQLSKTSSEHLKDWFEVKDLLLSVSYKYQEEKMSFIFNRAGKKNAQVCKKQWFCFNKLKKDTDHISKI